MSKLYRRLSGKNVNRLSASFAAICLICALFFSTDVFSKDSATSSELFMVTMQQIPYGFESPSGQKKGVLFEVLNKIMDRSGIGKFNLILPPRRITLLMKNISSVCQLQADTPESKQLTLIEPIGFQVNMGILASSNIKLDSYSDLKNMTIAIPLGLYFHEKLHQDKSFTIITPSEYIDTIRLLKKGRIDAVGGAIPILLFLAKKEKMLVSKLGAPLTLKQNEIYLVCTNSTPKFIQNKLKQTIIELKSDGVIQIILDSYFH